MPRVRVRRVKMVAAQGAAIGVATVFLVVGIAGFVPGITTHLGTLRWHGGDPAPHVFGVFAVSVLHNFVHLFFGVAGLLASRTFGRSRLYLLGGGLIYLALWILGVLQEPLRAAIPLNNADNWLHLAIGVIMVILGLTLAGTRVPTGAEGEVLVPE